MERDVFSKRFSSDNPTYHHHIRDYHTLCRGEKLVKNLVAKWKINILISYIFQLFRGEKAFLGYCELRTNNDPWLKLAPIKVSEWSE